MRTISFLTVCLLLPASLFAEDRGSKRKAAAKRFELRVEEEGWKGADHINLRAVCDSACSEITVHFSGKEKLDLEPIRIRHDKSGPIVLFKRSLREELVVLLSSKGTYWSQHAYQIAHEFCHILCRFKEGDKTNLWFEESLCELASIYSLRQMAITWKKSPPYSNWKSYADSLRSYAEDVEKKHALPENQSFADWFRKNREQLTEKATQRELNGIVAVQLLPIFEANPEAWQTLPYLNVGRGKEQQSFNDYLRAWHDNTPEGLRAHVAKITREFKL
ncbi:MAG: hypothetical protein ACI9UA_006063 [Pseudoalteromonas tetraodonis]|jgi:hypothetical protein